MDTFGAILNGSNSVRDFLSVPVLFEPGTHFLYNNGVSHILALVVQKVAGMDYVEYLRPRFLDPAEVYCTVEETERGELEGSRTVTNAEGFAKLSLLYLQEGVWNGKQLLRADLARAACEHQVASGRCSSVSFMHEEQFAGYGYQIWRNRMGGARLDGGRGQFGFLFYDQELAIVCNAVVADSGIIPQTFFETIYLAVDQPEADQSRELAVYLENWNELNGLWSDPGFKDDYYGATFTLEENAWEIEKMGIDWKEGVQLKIRLTVKGEKITVDCGLGGEWVENEILPLPRENDRLNSIFRVEHPVSRVSGGWLTGFCFVFQVRDTD